MTEGEQGSDMALPIGLAKLTSGKQWSDSNSVSRKKTTLVTGESWSADDLNVHLEEKKEMESRKADAEKRRSAEKKEQERQEAERHKQQDAK